MSNSTTVHHTEFIYVLLKGEADPVLYDCSSNTTEEWYSTGVSRPAVGAYFIVSGVIFEILYVLCLAAMTGHEMMQTTCYRIMYYLGVLDVVSIFINSIATGYFAIIGAVYCTHPHILMTMGAIGCGCWCAACMACILLALNRCADLSGSGMLQSMFKPSNTWLVLLFPTTYFVFIALFTTPASFNSVYVSWFFNPMNGGDPMNYTNPYHAINNCVVSICATVLYTYLCTKIFAMSGQADHFQVIQMQVMIQASLICAFNALAAYIYVYMQYFPVSQWIILMGQVAWQFSSGSAAIIYLMFNKIIRKRVIRMVVPPRLASHLHLNYATSVGPSRVSVKTVLSEHHHI